MTLKEFKTQLALGTLSYEAIYDIARDPQTSPEILDLITRTTTLHDHPIMVNPSTSVDTLIRLVRDVRIKEGNYINLLNIRWMLQNRKTMPPEVINVTWKLHQNHPYLLCALLARNDVPVHILNLATEHSNFTVRIAAIKKSNTPIEKIVSLLEDRSRNVRDAAVLELWHRKALKLI